MKKFTRRLSNVFFPVLDENDLTDIRSICSTTSSLNDFGYAANVSDSSSSSSDFEERSGLSHKFDSLAPVRGSTVSLRSPSILEEELEYDAHASSSSSSEHKEHKALFRKLDIYRRNPINGMYDEIVDHKLNSTCFIDDKNNSQLQGIIDRK